jgi:hypothetical protein
MAARPDRPPGASSARLPGRQSLGEGDQSPRETFRVRLSQGMRALHFLKHQMTAVKREVHDFPRRGEWAIPRDTTAERAENVDAATTTATGPLVRREASRRSGRQARGSGERTSSMTINNRKGRPQPVRAEMRPSTRKPGRVRGSTSTRLGCLSPARCPSPRPAQFCPRRSGCSVVVWAVSRA